MDLPAFIWAGAPPGAELRSHRSSPGTSAPQSTGGRQGAEPPPFLMEIPHLPYGEHSPFLGPAAPSTVTAGREWAGVAFLGAAGSSPPIAPATAEPRALLSSLCLMDSKTPQHPCLGFGGCLSKPTCVKSTAKAGLSACAW